MKYFVVCLGLALIQLAALQAMEKPQGISLEGYKKHTLMGEKMGSLANEMLKIMKKEDLGDEQKIKEAEALIEKGKREGVTEKEMFKIALIEGIRAGKLPMVKWAVNRGAEVKDTLGLNQTIWQFANTVEGHRADILDYLKSKGAQL